MRLRRHTSIRTLSPHDLDVGRVTSALYSDIAVRFGTPTFVLMPALVFKIKKVMEGVSLESLTEEQKDRLADDIRVSLVPLFFALDLDPAAIDEMADAIQETARRAMN